jgi:hypothetical protein
VGEHWGPDLSRVDVGYAATDDGKFVRLLSEQVARIVWIAGRRPGTAAIEPELDALLAHVKNNPQHRAISEREMCRYAGRLAEDPPDPGLVEMLQFCMATLRWPAVLAALDEIRAAAEARYAGGQHRAWQVMHDTGTVIEAFTDDWAGGEVFERYRRD